MHAQTHTSPSIPTSTHLPIHPASYSSTHLSIYPIPILLQHIFYQSSIMFQPFQGRSHLLNVAPSGPTTPSPCPDFFLHSYLIITFGLCRSSLPITYTSNCSSVGPMRRLLGPSLRVMLLLILLELFLEDLPKASFAG